MDVEFESGGSVGDEALTKENQKKSDKPASEEDELEKKLYELLRLIHESLKDIRKVQKNFRKE